MDTVDIIRQKDIGYSDLIEIVEEHAKIDLEQYKGYSSYKQVQRLCSDLKLYCDKTKSANRYKKLEQTKPIYARYRRESEYLEFLSSARLRLSLQVSDANVLNQYVTHLKSKVADAHNEADLKKRFFLYDYICAGCFHCKVDNDDIMNQIKDIRENAKEIIQEIPTM